MGVYQGKYTKEYYDGGQSVNGSFYGAEKNTDGQGSLILREQDRRILEKIDFCARRVLCLGCGRGEEIVFALQNGASFCTAVDFSPAAIEIAGETVKSAGYENVAFVQEDISDFVKSLAKNERFDIVAALDVIEHIPRDELKAALIRLRAHLSSRALVVINTPCYRYDNDVIKDGYDVRNDVNCYDSTERLPETAGMHCNKYTCVSLQMFMEECGFLNVTRAHYFVMKDEISENLGKLSYGIRWQALLDNGFPLVGAYDADAVDFPYTDAPVLKPFRFTSGALDGLTLLMTQSYKDDVYCDGEVDIEAMEDLELLVRRRPNVVVFDAGDFFGANAMAYAKKVLPNGRAVIFEPNPYNRERIFENLSLNPDAAEMITVEPFALSAEDATVPMTLSSSLDNGLSSTSRIDGAHSTINSDQLPGVFFEMDIPTMTLDRFVTENQLVPDLIKADIEGAEYLLLLGAQKLIEEHRPVFHIEYHSEYCATMCTAFLMQRGYAISILLEEADNRVVVKAEYAGTGGGIETTAKSACDSDRTWVKTEISNNRLRRRNERLAERNVGLIEEAAELIEEAAELNRLYEKMRTMNNSLMATNKLLEFEIKTTKDSYSWRLTAPLRKLRSMLNGR